MTALLALLLFQPPPPDSIDPFKGTWRLIPESASAIKPAIDRSVAKMNFLIRGVARSRLTARNPASPEIEVRREPNQLHLRIEGFTNRPHPLNGETWRRRTQDGEVDIQLIRLPDGFATRYTNNDGSRENRFEIKDAILHMHVTITSRYLTEPVRYTLRYQLQ